VVATAPLGRSHGHHRADLVTVSGQVSCPPLGSSYWPLTQVQAGELSKPDAAEKLQDQFGLSEVQADAILDMRLARLTALERMGKKSAENVVAAVQASRERTLDRLLCGLGIHQIVVKLASLGEDVPTVHPGLGNLLVDEILWRARIHPTTSTRDLTYEEWARLHRRIRSTVRAAVPTGRVPPRSSWLTGRRDDSDPLCPRCGTELQRTRVNGRSTVWCPSCQPSRP
jgi:hypothetical protein